MKKLLSYFSKTEQVLWCTSAALIVLSFLLFGRNDLLTLCASLIGVTSLLFNAKGNPVGQLLMVIFSLLYGVISWQRAYYGEMFTYLGMTMPMALFALISWLRNPFRGNRSEVTVNRLARWEWLVLPVLTAAVTAVFYFILAYFHTAYLPLSTFSVTTSFLAVYLTFRRSPWFALAYAANDVVLIALWALAAAQQRSFLCVVVCFAAFLAGDLYGFISWRRMARRQAELR
ncbi:MAG: nicotinamide mononucleotide transporter [Ruminococcaceae bacterium]|nr:nicotinamide mononucleotide transporter [Oscillospiraceae bacterium]